MPTHPNFGHQQPRDIVLALIATENRRREELVRQLAHVADNPSLTSPEGEICQIDETIEALQLELGRSAADGRPVVGVTYQPGPHVVPVSDGLPRTVTKIETRTNLTVYVVHYTTTDGSGFESDNLWRRWMKDTGAKPAAVVQ